MKNKIATTVKLEPALYDDFKVLGIRHKISLQDIVERTIYRYVNDETFRNKMNNFRLPKITNAKLPIIINPLPIDKTPADGTVPLETTVGDPLVPNVTTTTTDSAILQVVDPIQFITMPTIYTDIPNPEILVINNAELPPTDNNLPLPNNNLPAPEPTTVTPDNNLPLPDNNLPAPEPVTNPTIDAGIPT